MSDNFSQTVDLRDGKPKKEDPLEKIYGREGESKKDLQKISAPFNKDQLVKLRIIFFLAIFVLAVFGVWLGFFRGGSDDGNPAKKSFAPADNWYAVKLVDGEIFYGQIADTAADPVVIANVYYNYDQAKDSDKSVNEAASLKLVKRGKETHGPTGAMNVVRSQVIYMEPLASDSKVLQAILEYEK